MFKKRDDDINLAAYERWREAEALAEMILAAADNGVAWHAVLGALGSRSPDVVNGAFHIAFYREKVMRRKEQKSFSAPTPIGTCSKCHRTKFSPFPECAIEGCPLLKTPVDKRNK